MTTDLLFGFVALHAYSALAAGTFFYMSMLEAANLHRTRAKRLNSYAFLALLFSVLAWGLKLTILREYFQEAASGAGDFVPSSTVPLFEVLQTYIFPVVVLLAIMLFMVVWREGHTIQENSSARYIILWTSFFGFALSAVLMFLGVLIP